MLTQIFYSSRARDDLQASDIEAILASARRNNAPLGITEGEAEVLDGVLEQILADPRHQDARVFRRESITERNFGEWKMAYAAPTPGDFARWSDREGTVTIAELLRQVEEAGDALPRIVASIVASLAAENWRVGSHPGVIEDS